MTSLQFLTARLAGRVLSGPPEGTRRLPLVRWEMLDAQQKLVSGCVYLGDVAAVRRVLPAAHAGEQAVVLVAGDAGGPVRAASGKPVVVCTDCALPELCNAVSGVFEQAFMLSRSLFELTYRSADLQHMLTQAAELAQAPLVLLGEDGRAIAAGGMRYGRRIPGQLAADGGPEQAVRELFEDRPDASDSAALPPDGDVGVYGRRIRHEAGFQGVLLTELYAGAAFDHAGYCDLVAESVCRMVFHPAPLDADAGEAQLERFFADVVEGREQDPGRIAELIAAFPFPVHAFLRLMVVTLEGGQVPYSYVTIQLRQLFPESVVVQYHRSIVILYTYEKRTFYPNLDQERLHRLLVRYNGYMGISNGTRDWRMLRSLYLLSVQTIRVAKPLDRENRMFLYEDYGMYCIIDMCVQKFLELHGHDDILYLVHPAVIHISRHDRTNNDNLRDVLFYYLLSDRNIVRTAAATYMHRNTILKKVGRISQLVDIDFEDGMLRHRLLFSCQVIRYYEDYMKQKLRL